MDRNRRPPRFPRLPHGQRRGQNLTVERLEHFLTQEPSDITLNLSSNLTVLQEFLNQDLTYELAELFIKVLRESLRSTSLKQKNSQILSLVINSNFPSKISQILTNLNVSEQRFVQFFKDLIFIIKSILVHNPTEYLKTFQIIGVMNIVIDQDQDQDSIPEELKNLRADYEEVQFLLQSLVRRNQKLPATPSPETPPEDFRTLEIVPPAQVINSEDKVFLRKNKVVGTYDNVDHYLDVQFRLMREDFFSPIRKGIKHYLSLPKDQKYKRIDDLRIYPHVKILYPLCTWTGIAYKVQFDVSHLRVNWEQSKRLIYGSLVCLTLDDFQTIYFATVTERKVSELKEGLVDLMFFSSLQNNDHFSPTTIFTMAETTAYFEASRHILTALKEINEDNLPFQDYIIHGKSNVKAPKYLTQKSDLKMDLTSLTNDCKLVYNSLQNRVKNNQNSKSRFCLDILHDPWPSADLLELNDSQHEALQNVLTKEFSLTQGPPGTGKTYVGLKIVKALCANIELWQGETKSPILIVCYTNQALDKFLEEIAEFLKGGILRVGGRSTSEVLSKYFLKNVKNTYRNERYFKSEFISNKHIAIEKRNNLKKEIEEITNLIQQTKKGIVHEDFLQDQMGQFYDWLINSFQSNYPCEVRNKNSLLTNWLGYGNIEIFQMDMNRPNETPEELHENFVADNGNVYTDINFIQDNRMLDSGSNIDEEFSTLGIDDNELLTLKLKDLYSEATIDSDGFQKTKDEKKRLKRQLERDLNGNTILNDDEIDQIRYHDLWLMKKDKRWKLYRHWIAAYCHQLHDKIARFEIEYTDACKDYMELMHYEDGEIMKNSLIVGMTTTAAARYHNLLQEIQPKIIIVEEAAEILEAHVVTTLNPLCEQLILIGDHKQLRPNPNVYELARSYNLEISLFERMVINKCHVKCLASQHRMRPEISQLLLPIYPELQDHPSVRKYKNIKGLSSNLYFIQHNELEVTNSEGTSYSNPHEATFIAELTKYLIKQGYEQSQITVLTMYTAQLFQLKKQMKSECFNGVRLTVVDNFQGQENDIILLSLVRNNYEKKFGFLKNDNRVCVALSRAKMGFYVIGNFEGLSEQSRLWKNILTKLKSENKVGYALTLSCQNHPEHKALVREAVDFSQAPEGGCLKPCESRLECGHTCKRLCHPVDDHDIYECLEPCSRIVPNCPEKHKCNQICSQKCTPCMQKVIKIVPRCNHQQSMPCSVRPMTYICRNPCEKLLTCGHPCDRICGKFCTSDCKFEVEKTYICKHVVKSFCFQQSDTCPVKCPKILDCGHPCSSTCGKCSKLRVHSLCTHKCKRILICGHECQNKECNICSPCKKRCQNRCVHNKCMKLCGELCVPCKEPCQWNCDHYKCTRYCHEPCDRPKCDQRCLKRLRCGHQCVGLCGEKCPRLCAKCNTKDLKEIFFGTEEEADACFVELEDCGHIFEKSGLDQWMSQKQEGEIQLKLCPKCKVPIRRNLRYGQIINNTLMDINMIKDKLIGHRQEREALCLQIEKDIEDADSNYIKSLKEEFHLSKKSILKGTLPYWDSFNHRVTFLLALCKLMKQDAMEDDSNLQQDCKDFSRWISSHEEIFSESQLKEIEAEIERVRKVLQFYDARRLLKTSSAAVGSKLKDLVGHGLQLLMSKDYLDVEDEVSKIYKQISEDLLIIKETEKVQIVKAVGLTPGHWFKCPQGHFYVIGECGGATERSKCPECGSTIGGASHRLEEGNTLAPEMDGARYPAYSEEANDMANFQLNEF